MLPRSKGGCVELALPPLPLLLPLLLSFLLRGDGNAGCDLRPDIVSAELSTWFHVCKCCAHVATANRGPVDSAHTTGAGTSRWFRSWPVATSHSHTVPSCPALTAIEPKLRTATTLSAWPSQVQSGTFAVRMSHTSTRVSELPVKNTGSPSAPSHRQVTGAAWP